MPTPLIQLDDLRVTYKLGDMDIPVLKGITLEIAKGELVALMGASGSGKSTLMNVLGCLSRPTSGSYVLEGVHVQRLSADARAHLRNEKIGFVFQNFQLLPRTTALEQVLMPLDYSRQKLSRRAARERAENLLKRVGLADRMGNRPNQMSGGQQQRVAIARSLINEPSILFADEPTGNLDSKTSEEILGMFRDLNRKEGITILLVTHDPKVAAVADRAIHIKDGLIETGAYDSHAAHLQEAH